MTWLTPAAQVARPATRDIPIVMASAANPVETGLVESLARPGGNVTGVAGMGAERVAKTVEILQEMLPSIRRLAAIAFAPDPFSARFLEQVRRAAAQRGTTVEPIMIQGPEEFDAAFDAMQKDRPDAVIVQATIATKHAAELALSYWQPRAGWRLRHLTGARISGRTCRESRGQDDVTREYRLLYPSETPAYQGPSRAAPSSSLPSLVAV